MSLTTNKKIQVHKIKDIQANFIPTRPNHNINININNYKKHNDKKQSALSFSKQNNSILNTFSNINTQSIQSYKKNLLNNHSKQIEELSHNKVIKSNNSGNNILGNNFLDKTSDNININMNYNNLIPPNNISINNSNNVKVICRFRPINDLEKQNTKQLCIESIDEDQVEIKSKNEYGNFSFHFDKIFPMESTQKEIYEYSAKELVDSVLAGYNSTIFAYGQTASGKTYTMQGILDDTEKEGIIPRMVRQIFSNIMMSDSDIEFTVKVSILEIYMEKIRDLIEVEKNNLAIREKDKEIYVEDLSEHYVSTEKELMKLIKIGTENRVTSTTNMNENSSRSHTLIVLSIHQKNTKTMEAKTGKLYLVDLAGSEKISKTGSNGLTLEEAKIINKSLSTLGMVINALTDGKSTHIPYRESKLTRILTESLGGNAKTCLIITCSPSEYNESETLSTLRFGTRAKKIKNKPKINKEVTLQELKLKIEKLEKILLFCNSKISFLENYITGNGLVLPKMEEIDNSDNINNINNINNYNNFANKTYINNDIGNDISNSNSNSNKNIIGAEMDEIVNKYSNSLGKTDINNKRELMAKLEEANIKIADLQTIIDQKEKIEEEHEEKEKKLNEIINKLTLDTQTKATKDIITNEALIKTVSEKSDKIVRLESDVKEYKEKLELFEKQLTPDERNLHKKIYTLEKNLEQVNNMYHQVVTQKSVLKIENQLFEKKLKKRNEKIGALVKENYGLIEQLKKRDEKILSFQKNKNIPIPQVVKVIRGNGKNSNQELNTSN